MKKEKDYNWLYGIGVFVVMGLIFWVIQTIPKKVKYGLHPSPKEEDNYNFLHPIKGEIQPFHPNINNKIKIREFPVSTTMFYGELDGYGRTPFAYAGLANNPVDREIIRNIVKEELKSFKIKQKKLDRIYIRNKIDSLLSYKVYKGKNRKQRTINEIIELL